MTRDELITLVKAKLESTISDRWTADEYLYTADRIFRDEWGNILDAAPYHRFSSVAITTASDGTFPLSSLDTGSADSQKNFYRILSMNDGSTLYTETRFQDIPLAQFSNYLPYFQKLYYLAGTNYQTLPAGANTLNVVVNYQPTPLLELSSGGVAFDFPAGFEMLLVYGITGELQLKGADDDAVARKNFVAQCDTIRGAMLDELRRRTINPTRMAYPDSASDWAG
jgi:hypothetical protein